MLKAKCLIIPLLLPNMTNTALTTVENKIPNRCNLVKK